MRRILIVVLSLSFWSSVALSEPTKLQAQLINEKATMMDLFIYRNEIKLNNEYTGRVTFDPNDRDFPIETKDNKPFTLNSYISVYYDLSDGAFKIGARLNFLENELLAEKLETTISNGQNLCRTLLRAIRSKFIHPEYANHQGFETKTYSMNKDFMEFRKQTIRNASININYGTEFVMCEQKSPEDYTDLKYTLTGDWK